MNGPALLALQTIDSAIDHVEHRRTRLPEAAHHAQQLGAIKEIERDLAAAGAWVAGSEAAIEAAEQASAALTTKRARLESQLKTVIAPREAEALMHEIELLTVQRGEHDDAELAAMDEMAEAEAEVARLRTTLETAVADAQRGAADLAAATAVLDQERDDLVAQRPGAAAVLTAEELDTYERLRRQFDGVAVAKLDGLRCQGCHLDLSRGEVDAVRALPDGEPGECPQCNRLLVR